KIALSFPELVRRILAEGHEAQFHAWDHRRWQDEVLRKDEQWIINWFEAGINSFEKLVGKKPEAFGAPGWVIDERVLKILSEFNFKYLSCTRAIKPFIHQANGLIEIPSDLPCFEEIGIENGVSKIMSLLENGGIHILPVHAEVEGGLWKEQFIELLEKIIDAGYQIKTLAEIYNIVKTKQLTTKNHEMTLLQGRAFPCAV
ncbi:MAG: polysaccharide deacetylase family protein, partial [Deltaproteobacteria bacterium]